MNYEKLWIELKKRLNNMNKNAHPRFKYMQEEPTIPIIKVLEIMKNLEDKK